MKNKAVKIETYRSKYTSTVVYEYRGKKYEVEYSNCWTYCITPAWIQHRDAQEKIDEALDNPKSESNEKPFTEQLDEVWQMMGW